MASEWNRFSTEILAILANAAVRSLIVAAVMALVATAFRVKTVAARLLIWRYVLIVALAMPLLTWICPSVNLLVPIPIPRSNSAILSASSQSIARTRMSVSPIISSDRPGVSEQSTQVAPPSAAENHDSASRERSSSRRRFSFNLLILTALLWAAVTCALMVRLLVGVHFSRRLERTSAPLTGARMANSIAAVSRALNLIQPPRVAESDLIAVPLMLGVRKPVIVLPADWRDWTDEEVSAVLAHEASHVQRKDALVQRLCLIHRAVFWFSPLSWYLAKHLADLSEQASDEAALAGGADRSRYAAALLNFFKQLEAGPQRVWWQGVSMAKPGQAGQRIERILARRPMMSSKIKKSFVVAFAVVALPAVALTASLHPSVYTPQDPGQPAAPETPAPPDIAVTPPPPLAPQHSITAPAPAPAPQEPGPVVVVPPIPEISSLRSFTLVVPNVPNAAELRAMVSRALHSGYVYGYEFGGSRFVIVRGDSEDNFIVSGSSEDVEHASALRSKIQGHFIWFERDEKSYIIRDPGTVQRAEKLWEPIDQLGKQQADLGKQQEELGKQQEELSKKMQEVRVKVPDLSAQIQKIQEQVKQLASNGGTPQEIGELQRAIGDLQHQIGETQWDAGHMQGDIGRQQGELGRKQGELGHQQGELGRQQAEASREAAQQMRTLLDDAVAHGTAQPE